MHSGIGQMDSGIDHMGSGIDQMGSGIDPMGSGIDHMGSGIDHMRSGIDHMGSAFITWEVAEEFSREWTRISRNIYDKNLTQNVTQSPPLISIVILLFIFRLSVITPFAWESL